MPDTEILNEIRNELNSLKEEIIRMEITINEIDSDVHKKLNPECVKSLIRLRKKIKEFICLISILDCKSGFFAV